jgi:hypothetical protein
VPHPNLAAFGEIRVGDSEQFILRFAHVRSGMDGGFLGKCGLERGPESGRVYPSLSNDHTAIVAIGFSCSNSAVACTRGSA